MKPAEQFVAFLAGALTCNQQGWNIVLFLFKQTQNVGCTHWLGFPVLFISY